MEKTDRSLKEILNGFDRAVNVGFIVLSHGQHIGKFREVGSGRLTSASPVPELSNFFPRPIWGLNPGGRKEEIFICCLQQFPYIHQPPDFTHCFSEDLETLLLGDPILLLLFLNSETPICSSVITISEKRRTAKL